MPSVYAHRRLGLRSLDLLPQKVQDCINRNPELYGLGLHGPDLMIFHDPIRKDEVYELNNFYHRQTGRQLFTKAAEVVREGTDEGAISFIYGLLGHFTLDSSCHPFVREVSRQGCPGHLELESDFDRHLLELDGKVPAYTQKLTGHLKLRGKRDIISVTKVFALTPKQVRECLRRFRLIMALFTAPEGKRRDFLLSGKLSATASEMVIRIDPNPRCAEWIPELMDRYQQAEALYPVLMEQFLDLVETGAPLSDRFDITF